MYDSDDIVNTFLEACPECKEAYESGAIDANFDNMTIYKENPEPHEFLFWLAIYTIDLMLGKEIGKVRIILNEVEDIFEEWDSKFGDVLTCLFLEILILEARIKNIDLNFIESLMQVQTLRNFRFIRKMFDRDETISSYKKSREKLH